jgi:hypothetical protein
MKCAKCGNEIPAERLAILPNTRVCVKCSTEKPKLGFMTSEKKMHSELTIVSADDTASLSFYRSKKKLL